MGLEGKKDPKAALEGVDVIGLESGNAVDVLRASAQLAASFGRLV